MLKSLEACQLRLNIRFDYSLDTNEIIHTEFHFEITIGNLKDIL